MRVIELFMAIGLSFGLGFSRQTAGTGGAVIPPASQAVTKLGLGGYSVAA